MNTTLHKFFYVLCTVLCAAQYISGKNKISNNVQSHNIRISVTHALVCKGNDVSAQIIAPNTSYSEDTSCAVHEIIAWIDGTNGHGSNGAKWTTDKKLSLLSIKDRRWYVVKEGNDLKIIEHQEVR